MEHYFPFDSELVDGVEDRLYYAINFTRFFKHLISNGIFAEKGDGLEVLSLDNNMYVSVMIGDTCIEGAGYENDSIKKLKISTANIVNNRIDIIVNRLDNKNRMITTIVVEGVPQTTPVAPNIIRNSDYYDLKIAEVYVRAGTDKILQTDIKDYRPDVNVCGWVTGILATIDASSFFDQYRIAFTEFMNGSVKRMEELMEQVQTLLDEETATYLLGLIEANKVAIQEMKKYPKIEPLVLLKSGWSNDYPHLYIISDIRYSAVDSFWCFLFPDTMTDEQRNAFRNAQIDQVDDSKNGKLMFYASGIKPKVDIPLLLKIER